MSVLDKYHAQRRQLSKQMYGVQGGRHTQGSVSSVRAPAALCPGAALSPCCSELLLLYVLALR